MATNESDTPQWVRVFLWHSERYGMLLSRCQAILRKAGIPERYIGNDLEIITEQAGLADREFAEQQDFEAALKGWALNRAAELAALRPTPDAPDTAGNGQDAAAASAMRHGPDFRSLAWGDAQYAFTPSQAAVVKVLWEARGNRTPDVGEQFILESVDSCGSRVRDIFSKHPAWGTLIVPGRTKGTFRLAE